MSGGMDEQTRDEPSPQAIAVASAAQLVDAVQETFGPLGREVTNLGKAQSSKRRLAFIVVGIAEFFSAPSIWQP